MVLSIDSRTKTVEEIAERFVADLAQTAVQRDAQGGTALRERRVLRETGLLNLLIPEAWGGYGAGWPLIYRIIRQVSRVDSSIGQLFGFQHLMLATIDLYGLPEQVEDLFRRTVAGSWFWGNTLNPLDSGLSAHWENDKLVLNGRKSFSTGSIDADALIVSIPAPEAQSGQKIFVAAVPMPRKGILPLGDWDNMGQRQTDSGTVEFRSVLIDPKELLQSPGPFGSIRASLRPCVAQLIFANIYLGISEGAFAQATSYLKDHPEAWFLSGVDCKQHDPYIQRQLGELYAGLEAARLVTDRAAETLQQCWDLREAVSEGNRAQAAVDIATAKVITTRTGLQVVNSVFEVMGARSTSRSFQMDRFWRNLRTYTLHDPVEYKLRDLGNWALSDLPPRPSFYS